MSGDRQGRQALLLLGAIGAFGLTITASQGLSFLLIAAGSTLGVASLTGGGREGSARRFDLLALAITALFGILSFVGPIHDVIGNPPRWAFASTGTLWIGFAVIAHGFARNVAVRRNVFVAALVVTAGIGGLHILSASGTGLDVWLLHESAAEAIRSGASPYSASVAVPSGAPVGPPFIVGYPYPPLTAIVYSLGAWLGDPRWISLASWLVTLALIGRGSLAGSGPTAPLKVMLVAASVPGWPLVLTRAWTEPLSLALLAGAAAAWASPRGWGVLIGIYLGSKQYLLAVAPLLFTAPLEWRARRIGWAAAGLAVVFVPLALWDTSEFVQAAIRFHLDVPARTDGTSLVGLMSLLGVSWSPPTWLMVAGVIVVAWVAGRRAAHHAGWLTASALVLVATFLLSSQAFPNYWFLVMGILALAAAATESNEPDLVTAPPPPA
jgi:hypothetical protein